MTERPLQIEIAAEDAAVLSEAWDFAQFSELNLPQSVQVALQRVLQAIETANRFHQPKVNHD